MLETESKRKRWPHTEKNHQKADTNKKLSEKNKMEKSLKKETILLTSTINFNCSISEEQNFIESLGAELRIIFFISHKIKIPVFAKL